MNKTFPLFSILMFFFSSASMAASGTNIKGVVIDTAGNGLAGVRVLLEKKGIATTTNTNGSFTLDDNSDNIRSRNDSPRNPFRIRLNDNRMTVRVTDKSSFKMRSYTLEGRQFFRYRKTLNAGTHFLVLPLTGSGVHIHSVELSSSRYVFQETSGILPANNSAKRQPGTTDRLAFTMEPYGEGVSTDIIAATKEGMLDYRITVTTLDTSGIEIVMLPSEGTIVDIDGNSYQTVRLGKQVWTVDNLRTSRYNDGTAIRLINYKLEWDSRTSPAFCYCNGTSDADSIRRFGALYNFYVVLSGKLAPQGWHVPTDTEWTVLTEFLIANGYNRDGSTTENKISKSVAAKTDWAACPDTGSVGYDPSRNNRSGFNALPGGFRSVDGKYYSIGSKAYWWTADTISAASDIYGGIGRILLYSSNWGISFGTALPKNYGQSIRLVKDD